MKHFLLLIIKSYWLFIPPNKRRKCLFKKSCSHYVFDITQEDGLLKGIGALRFRYKHCRSGYYLVNGKDGKLLISARNKVFDAREIKDRILKNY